MKRRLHDLGLGIRFAVSGGREGWVRTLLTAVGVGLGVALLLGAASVPHLNDARADRIHDRQPFAAGSDRNVAHRKVSLLYAVADTEYRDDTIGGKVLRPANADPVLPPGLTSIPAPGTMAVSPALRDLLASPEGELLRPRLPYEITATIADAGLVEPSELYYYAGDATLATDAGASSAAGFGAVDETQPLDPMLVVLVILSCVVLLMPVAIFIATAVRFGGERRDRRLAALRLVGADTRTTRWVAGGEALAGAVLGLAVGTLLFLGLAELIGPLGLWSFGFFPGDLRPLPWLALLVAVAVPALAVGVTLAAMRSVSVEPLGVVRGGRTRRRRVWWRVAMPGLGVVLLFVSQSPDARTVSLSVAPSGIGAQLMDAMAPVAIAAGATLVLAGLITLLPWLVEAVVGRLHGGSPSWQLAVRRLQLSSGAASRAVSGITVAVAGSVALQMFFVGIHDDFTKVTGADASRAQYTVLTDYPDAALAERMIGAFRGTPGVSKVIGSVSSYVTRPGPVPAGDIRPITQLTLGDCATLRELARIDTCTDGDTFVVHPADAEQAAWVDRTARPGEPVNTAPDESGVPPKLWTLPAAARTVAGRPDPTGEVQDGIFATPGAMDTSLLTSGARTSAMLTVDQRVPDAAEHIRNTAARLSPQLRVATVRTIERDRQYAGIQTGLQAASLATLGLIAAGMLVSQVEQLRERRRLLAALVAFGTRRSTLAGSVLWQTAVPVALGIALAVAGGTALGALMLRIIDKSVTGWWLFLPLAGAGAAVILAVTLLSLPVLWRQMRPEGLRTE
ncbi:ABC transporter permease [Streptomyces sp. NBC_00083]|uniref:ABC transporter permease n=1 Tax=Streptomyces sp. NBC_00083 TaxID=2975647 RepID=UPI00224CB201|nr:FtsX-like permease family protein [Streptomyces sp. NBC_00083]MCX5385340.1 ABC transporter permease [Streptomyces sp. NBC_00083]